MANFEFKPFDKVLVRNRWSRWSMWIPAFYGMKSESKHLTSAGWQDECIPYEGNEEYLGTSNNYVDKVSKFKVGDWLVENEPNNYARFVQILEVVDIQGKKRYRISRDLHNDEDVAECRFVEKYYHPFNIQDAKDGDVLATKDAIFIFKHKDKTGRSLCKSYCEVIGNSKLGFGFDFSINDVHPATKEQRDIMMKAMADAGYTFDFEEKELKKVEQNTELTDFESALFTAFSDAWQQYLGGEEVKVAQWTKEHSAELLEAAGKENAEWSEEDEHLFQIIIDILDKEEHKGHLSHTDLIACVRKLKFLRPQNHWKPSDQELGAILAAIGDERQKGSDVAKELLKIYQQLKKLKE